ncbi:sensor histidine kinase, partial [Streptomyces triticirhizae]
MGPAIVALAVAWAGVDVSAVGGLIVAPGALALAAAGLALSPPPAWRPALRQGGLAALGAAAALLSLIATVAYGGSAPNQAALWWCAETVGLLALFLLVARRPPPGGWALAGAPLALAVTVLPLRLGLRMEPPAEPAELLALCLTWAMLGLAAVAAGRYLSLLDRRRLRAVAAARREQRLALARDLHDFVAHEVSGMLVQAQAGRLVGASDPAVALDALRRVEEAGQRALASLDRSVRMLHDDGAGTDPGPEAAEPGLADVAALVERFGAGLPAEVVWDAEPAAFDPAPPERLSALAHRVVLEGLTNVRRHAPDAARIVVGVRREAGALCVSVTDDGRGRPAGGRRGSGLGLPGLA